MIHGNRSTFFLQADEIDHLTVRVTDLGEKLNRTKAVDMIKTYHSAYESVKNALAGTDVSLPALSRNTDEELLRLLITIRGVLLDTAFA